MIAGATAGDSARSKEGFLASLQPDEVFLVGGRTRTCAVVESEKRERARTVFCDGSKMALTLQLAHEELQLRREALGGVHAREVARRVSQY
jgi:hypothetical protein